MASKAIVLSLLIVATFVVLQSHAQGGILTPNNAEKQICEDNRNGRTLVDCKKDRRLSCHVVADYRDEETGEEFRETYNSPDGQLCCDLVGGLPTGCCKEGSCPPGMVMNCKRQDVFA